ncbi:Gag polyprotein [Turdus rufiventris]|nr:Gag polyprotein [Turdus rufiventris]
MRPSWDAQMEEGRLRLVKLRGMVIQGMWEELLKGQNMSKAVGECQKKEESPIEWLERLKKSIRIYLGMDPDSPIGKILLKTQFVAKSWEDIRRKLKKIEGWQEKELQELLREAQRVYVKREEEQQKAQAKVLVAAMREAQKQERTQGNPRPAPNQQTQKKLSPPPPRRNRWTARGRRWSASTVKKGVILKGIVKRK